MNRFKQMCAHALAAGAMLLWMAGCSDDEPSKPVIPEAVNPPGVYIVNEGGFNHGNASLSFYIPDSNKVVNDVFTTYAGKPLGDVAHSVTIHDGLLYIVVNNSDKIEVLNVKNHAYVRTIQLEQGSGPRFILFGPNNLGYISNQFKNTVSVYNPSTNAITKTIPVGDKPEQLYYSNNYIYVANSGWGRGRTISVVNISTNDVTGTINVGDGPMAFAKVSAIKFGVVCAGSYGDDFNSPADDTPGKVFIIDIQTKTAIDSVYIGEHPEYLVADGDGNLLTKTSTGIHRIVSSTLTLNRNVIAGNFYGLHFDARRNRIYVTNAKDFQSPGEIWIYNASGNLLNKFDTGINPSRMVVTE